MSKYPSKDKTKIKNIKDVGGKVLHLFSLGKMYIAWIDVSLKTFQERM